MSQPPFPNAFSGFGFTSHVSKPATDPQASETERTAPGDFEITMSGGRFHPERLVIPAGSTVTWVNADPRTHSVVAARFESHDIQRNERWSYTLIEPGTYVYERANHRGMEGGSSCNEGHSHEEQPHGGIAGAGLDAAYRASHAEAQTVLRSELVRRQGRAVVKGPQANHH